ncbi:seryl-tRNA synthetase [Mariprofundus aestuarium]|uniref:Serine--tRNA ligase n=1 Tax=Mariprofundus aestuarium TaxID=1921086 RepID=A0A2K8L1T1_MARES|nr:serine--tRNA ligase [Mariprofundus aestuarium]ATX79791.1 seryl-tRNA synthetase [Mariprofundus aestuarium]
MIDRQALRRDFEGLQAAIARRGGDVVAPGSAWAKVAELDARQRELKTESETQQAERNRASKAIGMKKGKGEDASAEIAAMGEVSRRVKELDALTKEAEAEFAAALLEIPNPLHDSVPAGDSEDDNVELRSWGTPRTDEVPAHWDIGTDLGILDFEAGATLAGSRFTVIKGAAARMERALMQFMLDLHADRHGYEEVWVPAIANTKTMTGTGQLPKFADDLYKLEGEDQYLIPTAEVPVTNLYQDKILDIADLPKRHCAYTPCFRREAGSAGRDERGIIRQHQFDKVELVHITTPERALTDLDELVSHAEAVLEALELPYRTVQLCTADIGFSSQLTFDLEVWLPSQNCYREISSCSSFGQFQGRRAGIRYRDENGKNQPAATLNGSGLAIGRTLVAILENYWQEDGSVRVPTVLQPYMGGMQVISN